MSAQMINKSEGRARAVRRLWYAAGCFALTLVIYYASGGTGRFGLLVGAMSAFISVAMLIFLVAGIYGLIKYR